MSVLSYKSGDYVPMYIGKTALEASCRINSSDLRKLKVERHEQGIDILEVCNKLNQKWRISRKAIGDGEDVDAQRVELELRQEKLLNERIKNQLRLGVLIPKPEAQNRILKVLVKFREFTTTFIRKVSFDQVLAEDKPNLVTLREWEEYLTSTHNALFDALVEEEVEIKDWETDGSAKLLQTRLNNAKTDNDIDEIILVQGGIIDG